MNKSSVKSERKMLTHVIDYCNGIDGVALKRLKRVNRNEFFQFICIDAQKSLDGMLSLRAG